MLMNGGGEMDIANAKCGSCGELMEIIRLQCFDCGIVMDGRFEASALARLAPEDQVFVVAFLRHHGSLKQMERIFDISYPTVKNRLHALNAKLDRVFDLPSPSAVVLDQLACGDISVDEALKRLG
jgi:hypothetical protein